MCKSGIYYTGSVESNFFKIYYYNIIYFNKISLIEDGLRMLLYTCIFVQIFYYII